MTDTDLLTELETVTRDRVKARWLSPGEVTHSSDPADPDGSDLLRFEFLGYTGGQWLPAVTANAGTRIPVSAGPYVRAALLEILLDRAGPAIEAGLRAFDAQYTPSERAGELEFYPSSQRPFQALAQLTAAAAPTAARRCDALTQLHATLPVTASDWLAVDEPPQRYALLERSAPHYGGEPYITTHRSPADAFKANAAQDRAEDWLPVELIDLDLNLAWPLERTTAYALFRAAAAGPEWPGEWLAVYGVKYSAATPHPASYDRSQR